MRLFIAVDLPAPLRERLDELLERLRREAPDVKWTRSAGIHLTLKFLGEAGEARVAGISKAVGAAVGEIPGGFQAAVERLGTFGDRNRPRVVWAGVSESTGALARVQSAVETACESEGFERERRPFSPHLTLARPKAPSRTLARALEPEAGLSLGSFDVRACCLFQSLLRPEGAAYVRLREFPLAAGAGSP